MFSVEALISAASAAIAVTASALKRSSTCSVLSSSVYWRTSEFSGSVRMRSKSSAPSDCSSTRIGKRPCISGMRSAGRATWKAPAAMNRMWSVRTTP